MVEAILPDPVPTRARAVVEAYGREHGVEPDEVGRVASAVRALLRFATRTDISMDALRADVRTLAADRAEAVLDVVGPLFEPLRARIQAELAAKTVTGHGKVLTDFEWRLETISASSVARGLRVPLVTLTLRYEEAGATKTVTLHALPTILKRLKDALAKIVV